ncbi:MAG: response regulator [Planctomycetes bacterium]|nr:response regulator [Planctomycetota bacterium]
MKPAPSLHVSFALALGLTGLALAAAGWRIWSLSREVETSPASESGHLQAGELLARQREVMSLSAALAASTGGLEGEPRHAEAFRLLDAQLQDAKAALDDAASGFPAARARVTHARLDELERRAFDLVREGRPEEAARLLAGPEYLDQQREYGQEMQAVAAALRARAEERQARLRGELLLLVAAFWIALPVLLLGWFRLRRRVDERLVETEKSLEGARHGREDLELKVRERTADLLRSHGDLRKEMEARLRVEEQLRHSQKMEAVGRLAGGLAHEFNNLATVVRGHCDLVLNRLPGNDPVREEVSGIREAAERTAALVHRLWLVAQRKDGEPRVLDLRAVAAEMEAMLRGLLGEDIRLSLATGPAPGFVRADRAQMENVLLQLAANSRDAMPTGGRLTLEVRTLQLRGPYADRWSNIRPNPWVVLSVSDTGCGMDAETQSHLFEPYFTTQASGTARGLGLSTVYGIVKQSGGHISVHSEPGKGTTIQVYLPQVSESGVSLSPDDLPVRGAAGTETVLLAEDEPSVRELIRRFLAMDGYTVLAAGGGDEAVAMLQGHPGPVHLLVADVVMPGMDGPQLAARVKGLRPESRVLYISGHPEATISRHGLAADAPLLHKPFTPGALSWKVREILDGTGSVPAASPGDAG